MSDDYVPPMPGTDKTPAQKAAETRARRRAEKEAEAAADQKSSSEFPRSTPEEKAAFAKGFGGASREEATPKKKRTPNSRKLEENLEELFSALSLPFLMTGDEYSANIVAKGAPKMAAAWTDLADENAGVKRFLTRLTEGSAWGGVILSTASVVIPIAAHKGVPMGPLSILGGGSSSTPTRASGAHPSAAPAPVPGSAMGAPTVAREPPVARATDGYIPRDPRAGQDAPAGVVLVGNRNNANASGANGAAAVS